MKYLYIAFAYIGLGLIWYGMHETLNSWGWAGYVAVGIWFIPVIIALFRFSDSRLNKVLRYTALLLLSSVIWTIIDIIINLESLHIHFAQL